MSTVDLGQYAQWYNFATSEQMMELTGMDPYDEDVQSVLASYGLSYVGWAVAKDEYFDTFMDNGLEYCLVAQDPETQEIDLYEWVGERLYPAIDDIMSIDFDGYGDEDMIYECADMKGMLKEAFSLQEALINPEDVEYMDDMELEEFLQDRLNDAEQEVLEKLGLYLEPNGSGRMGTFIIYDNNSNELAEISFEDYTDNELNIAYECNTIKQYQKKYTSWLKKLLPKKKKKQLILYTCPEANPPGLTSDDYTSLPLRVHLRHKSSKSHFDQKFVREVIHVGDPDYGSLLSASYNAGWFFLDSWQEDLQKFLDKYHEYFPEYPSAEDFAPDSTTYFVVGEHNWDDDEDNRVGYVPVGNKMKKLGTPDKFPLPYEHCHYFRIDDVEGWNKIAAGHIVESLTEEVSESPLRQYSRDPYGFDGWERELKQMVDEGKLSWEQACMICLAAVDNLKYVDEIVAKMGMYNESLR